MFDPSREKSHDDRHEFDHHDNWVAQTGGLPHYIKEIAKAIRKDDPAVNESRSIAIAVSRCRVWAASPNTHPDTKAKAAAAIAEWDAKRAMSKARTAAS